MEYSNFGTLEKRALKAASNNLTCEIEFNENESDDGIELNENFQANEPCNNGEDCPTMKVSSELFKQLPNFGNLQQLQQSELTSSAHEIFLNSSPCASGHIEEPQLRENVAKGTPNKEQHIQHHGDTAVDISSGQNQNQYDTFYEIEGKYKIIEKIGEGTFSSVYKAISLRGNGKFVALKRIYPVCSPDRILNEILHIKQLGGHAHVAQFIEGIRKGEQVTIVLPFFENDKFKDTLPHMAVKETRYYMKALLESLRHLHSFNVVHRDIKPGNFLYNLQRNEFLLIDFGLAQTLSTSKNVTTDTAFTNRKRKSEEDILSPVKKLKSETSAPLSRSASWTSSKFVEAQSKRKSHHAPRGGTRGFRAPEVLLRVINQTVAIDIWSAGVILLCILSTRYPFFTSPDDLASLAEISALCGTKEVRDAAYALGKNVEFSAEMPRQNFRTICERLSCRTFQFPDNVYDLLERCLDLNPISRITASDALKHPFFLEEVSNSNWHTDN